MNTKVLNDSIRLINEMHLKERLNGLYKTIPEGECTGCGRCCGESVRTHYVEFLNIYEYMKKHNLISKAFKKRLLTFYFTELVEVRECPFRDHGKCLIYPVRPLVCRLFGHIEENEHLAGLQATHAQNKEAADYIKAEYGIDIPNAVIYKTIPYCRDFKVSHHMSTEERIELSTAILMMDSEFFKLEIIDEYHMDYGLVQWFIDLWIDPDEADEMRIIIAAEMLENGTSGSLKTLLKEKCQ